MIKEPKNHDVIYFVRYAKDGMNCTSMHATKTGADERVKWVEARGGVVKYVKKFVAEELG